jgi:hypothetical protein
MRAMADAVAEALIAWIGGLEDAPANATEGAVEVARRLAAVLPEVGTRDFETVLNDALDAARRTFEYSGPGYLAYIPGGGLFTAALAEFLAQGLNRYVGLWQPSPAIVQLEENVTRWLCGLPSPRATRAGRADDGGRYKPLRRRDGAAYAAGRGLPRRHVLRDRPGAGSGYEAATIAGFGARNASCPDDELGWTRTRCRRWWRIAQRASVLPGDRRGHDKHGAVDPLDAIATSPSGRDVVPYDARLRRVLPMAFRGSDVRTRSPGSAQGCSCPTAPAG